MRRLVLARSLSKRLALAAVAAIGALASVASVGCGAGADANGDDQNADTQQDALRNVEQPEQGDALGKVAWQTVSTGVVAKTFGSGKNVVVVCGGYGGVLTAVQKWTDELVRVKLGAEGFGEILSVTGPGLGINVSPSAVAQKITSMASGAQSIVVIGHSSGEATAATIIAALNSTMQAKTTAFALDGWGGIETRAFSKIYGTYYITAQSKYTNSAGRSVTVNSRNFTTNEGIASQYGATIVLDTSGSGCLAGDCVHDTLINSNPMDKSHFELNNDYTNFSTATGGGHVETRYLDVLGKCLPASKLTCPSVGGLVNAEDAGAGAGNGSSGDDN